MILPISGCRDEIRMRMKFGFAKVKAANKMKRLAAAKKQQEKKLSELKYPTVEEIVAQGSGGSMDARKCSP